jgi:hypothetical protein
MLVDVNHGLPLTKRDEGMDVFRWNRQCSKHPANKYAFVHVAKLRILLYEFTTKLRQPPRTNYHKMNRQTIWIMPIGLISAVSHSFSQTTAFTFQSPLNDGGGLAPGLSSLFLDGQVRSPLEPQVSDLRLKSV